jgi:transposase-like protein
MPEIDRLDGDSGWIDVEFVERAATPSDVMELGIQLHVAGLSLSDTVLILETFGVDRHRTTVQTGTKNADLQPAEGDSPNHVALDETVIQLTNERWWLYAAVDPKTNGYRHVRLFPTRSTPVTKKFLQELHKKHDVETAVFLVGGGPWLHAALHRYNLRFRHVTHGNRNTIERVFREVKRRTDQFRNTFSHVDPETAESWLQTFAAYENQRI